jgi:undecaprenyl-diphosphatase
VFPRSSTVREAVVALLAALIFFWLAATVRNQVPQFDTAVRAAAHSIAAPSLTLIVEAVTNLGNGWVIFSLAAIVVFCLERAGRRRDAVLLALAVIGAKLLEQAMKPIFQRPRPDPFFDYPRPASYSFPSGHALLSCAFYLTMARLTTTLAWSHARTLAAWILAVLLTLCIGFSRVYLGVHYPTDVLAGYAAAIAWTSILKMAANHHWAARIKPRDGLETDAPPER